MNIATHRLSSDELADIVEVARLHFIENNTQSEISEKLGKSQSTVSRLLITAQYLKLVSHRIEAPTDVKFADNIRKAYSEMSVPMQRVSVALNSQSDPKNKVNIGCAAGDVFLSILKDIKKADHSHYDVLRAHVVGIDPTCTRMCQD